MYKLVALWSAPKPEDRLAFEAAYKQTHVPLARALENIDSVDTILVGEGLEGTAAPYHRVAVMIWPDREAFLADEATEGWTALRADAGQMIERFGVALTSFMGEDG